MSERTMTWLDLDEHIERVFGDAGGRAQDAMIDWRNVRVQQQREADAAYRRRHPQRSRDRAYRERNRAAYNARDRRQYHEAMADPATRAAYNAAARRGYHRRKRERETS